MNEGLESNVQGAGQQPPAGGGMTFDASAKVAGPAIGLMVTAGIGIAWCLVRIALQVLGIGLGAFMPMGGAQPREAAWLHLVSGTVGLALTVVGIIVGVVIYFGASAMKKLES